MSLSYKAFIPFTGSKSINKIGQFAEKILSKLGDYCQHPWPKYQNGSYDRHDFGDKGHGLLLYLGSCLQYTDYNTYQHTKAQHGS